jgi:hypothetical protein
MFRSPSSPRVTEHARDERGRGAGATDDDHGVAAADRAEVRRIAVIPVELEPEGISVVALARTQAGDGEDRPRARELAVARARPRGLDEWPLRSRSLLLLHPERPRTRPAAAHVMARMVPAIADSAASVDSRRPRAPTHADTRDHGVTDACVRRGHARATDATSFTTARSTSHAILDGDASVQWVHARIS